MPTSSRTPAFSIQRQSRPISRILCTRRARRRATRGSHSSRRAIADALKLPTRRRDGGPILHLEDARLPTWNCSGWRLPCRSASQQPRCALTAPFHPYLIPACAGPSAVCFLLPCSACCHGWPLAITLPCGVRTFLALFGRSRRGRDCLACSANVEFNTWRVKPTVQARKRGSRPGVAGVLRALPALRALGGIQPRDQLSEPGAPRETPRRHRRKTALRWPATSRESPVPGAVRTGGSSTRGWSEAHG